MAKHIVRQHPSPTVELSPSFINLSLMPPQMCLESGLIYGFLSTIIKSSESYDFTGKKNSGELFMSSWAIVIHVWFQNRFCNSFLVRAMFDTNRIHFKVQVREISHL